MALTVFPTVVFHAGTGSDTAASGAGPATAVTGTAAAHTGGSSSTTITFTDSPDLSGVAQDGSHLLHLYTPSGRQWSRISTVDNTAKTCVVEDAFNVAAGTPVNYAIGGKVATLDHADSRTLWSTTGMKAGWTLETQDAQSLSGSAITAACSGSFATADIVIVATGATEADRTITQTANAACFSLTGLAQHWKDVTLHNSNGTKTAADGFSLAGGTLLTFDRCVLGDRANTNNLRSGLRRASGSSSFTMNDCEVPYCTDDGVNIDGGTTVYGARLFGSTIHHAGAAGLNVGATVNPFLVLINCILAKNAGDGLLSANTILNGTIVQCTFDGNGGDAMDLSAGGSPSTTFVCHSNQFTNNGGYGIRAHANSDLVKSFVDYNNYHNNTSGARLNLTAGAHDQTADPGYVDASIMDYRLASVASAGKGFPEATRRLGANPSTGTTSYVDMGAAQRQEGLGVVIEIPAILQRVGVAGY